MSNYLKCTNPKIKCEWRMKPDNKDYDYLNNACYNSSFNNGKCIHDNKDMKKGAKTA